MPINLSSKKLSSGEVIYQSSRPKFQYIIERPLESKNNFVYQIKIKSDTSVEKDAIAKWTLHDVKVSKELTQEEANREKQIREWAIEREIEILTHLRHPAIVEIQQIPSNNKLSEIQYWAESHLSQVGKFFVTEYLPHNSLTKWCREQEYQKDFVWIVKTISIILKAVKLAHEQEIVHLDIKPGNILFRSLDEQGKPSDPVLIDWGSARYLKDNLIGQQYSEGYSAPEREIPASPDPKMDVWALGGVLYAMLTGQTPDDKDLDLSGKIEVGESKTLHQLRDLVRKMRLTDPTDRISISDIQKSLRKLKTLAANESTAIVSKKRSLDRFSKIVNSVWVSIVIATLVAIFFGVKLYKDVYHPIESPIAITPTATPTAEISLTPTVTNTKEISPTVIQNTVVDSVSTPTLAPPPSIAVITPTIKQWYCSNECPNSSFANIIQPCNNDIVSGIVYVTGTSTVPPTSNLPFDKYKFEYRYVESNIACPAPDNAGYCQIGPDFKKPVINSTLGWFDTSSMSNGRIELRLSTVKTDSNYESCVIKLTVRN